MIEPPLGLGLMCKPPRPGATKTRLAASIGAHAAERLSGAFLKDCAAAALGAAQAGGLETMAFFRPADAGEELSALLGPRWPVAYADAGDLGATMLQVLRLQLARCPAGAMVMGADMPLITPRAILAAARGLRLGDAGRVAIIPSRDGGYCLIGVRSADRAAPLFARMTWSTPDVLDETLRRARDNGLTAEVLQPERDIDEVADLDWLRHELQADPRAAPATWAALLSLGDTIAPRA